MRAPSRARRSVALLAPSLLLAAALLAQPVSANPDGGTVVGGDATITTGRNTVQIDQKTRIVIIDWKSFNIAKGESTNFSQPDASSTAVNRIGGNDPSSILGKLTANGRIILINGNGIVFGAGAQINVGSLVATTHDASNADLMNGKATFSGGARGVVDNQGTITTAPGGIVGLIAGAVSNSGVISARLGTVTIGATSQFTLDFTGDGLVSFPIDAKILARAIDANGKPVEALIVNNGRIEGATVLLSVNAAANLVTNVVSMGGVISATNARNDGGKIVLDGGDGGVSITGTLTASSQTGSGGALTIKGGRIALTGATVSAVGPGHGGSIAIGDWSTAHVTVDAATRLDASAHRPSDNGLPPLAPSPSPAVVPTPQVGAPAQAARNGNTTFGNDFARIDRGATGFSTSVQFSVDGQSFAPIGSGGAPAQGNDMLRIGRGFVGSGTNAPTLGAAAADAPSLVNDMGHSDIIDVAPVTDVSSGDGGTITIIAQELEFHGTALAQGGALSGNGGTIETSGDWLNVDDAQIDTTAANGTTGLWSLDPRNVTISTGSTSGGSLSSGTFTPTADNSVLNVATLVAALASTNVTVTTGSTGSQNGDITVANAITWASNHTLTLNAARNIAINAAITATNGGLYVFAGIEDLNNSIFTPGTITTSAAGVINVDTFTLGFGNWTQSAASLPGFTAKNFSVDPNTWLYGTSSGSFLRVTGGDGNSSGTAYQIADIYGLMGIGFSTNTLSKNYKLVNNIDADGLADFASIGNDTDPDTFSGVLDGQNFTIDKLTSTGTTNGMAGLFGWNFTGTVKNLKLTNVTIGGASALDAGAVVAQMGATAPGTVTNVSVSGGTVSGTLDVGGLVGRNAGGTISNSSASNVTVSQSATNMNNLRDAGGLVGENDGTITQSYATGAVTASKQAGGLVGLNTGTISQSYATGAVTLSPHSGTAGNPSMGAGGFVGVNVVSGTSAATITQSYSMGSVTLSNANSANVPIGAFVGGNGGTINEAFATGYVTIASGSGTIGGFAGAGTAVNFSSQTKTGSLTSTYFDSGTTGQAGGATTAQLQGALPSGFNTVSSGVWATGAGLYPYFGWRYETTPEAVVGIAYSDHVGAALKGVVVSGLLGTSGSSPQSLGTASTGANGYFYLLNPTGTIPSGSEILTFLSGGTVHGDTFRSATSGSQSGMDIYTGYLRLSNAPSTLSASVPLLKEVLGSNSGTDFLYSVNATPLLSLNSGVGLQIDSSAASYSFNQAISTTGNVILNTGGATTQTGAITASKLLLLGASASYTLTNASNALGTLAANTSAVNIVNSVALSIGTVEGTSGVTSTGAVTLTATGSLTIASGARVLSGAGSNIVLSASAAFVNNQGSNAVAAGAGGRWLIYSANPAGDTFGGLDSANTAIWNATVTTLAPGSVVASGNRYIFANQPTLTFTTTNATKTYGTDGTSAIANAYNVSGYNAGIANAYLADSAASVFSGVPALSSAGTVTNASVAGGPYTITAALGTLSALNGYTFAFVNTGTLTVNPAVIDATTLTYSVANATGTYGTLATLGAVTLSGVLLADVGNVSGTITLFDGSNNAVTLSAALGAGAYVEKVTGLTGAAAGNYVLASSGNTNGTLTINPKALTYSVANANGTYGTLATAGAVTLSGVLAGDTANVTDTLGLFDSGNNAVTLAATTHAGSYTEKVTALTGSAAGNYVLASSGNSNGTLTINPKALTYNVANVTGTYGTLASLGAVTLTGIVGGDNVQATVTAYDGANNAVTLAVNTNAGGYTEKANALTGSAAGNYVLASSGNTNGTLTINPKALTYIVANATGTYGTLATLGAATLSGVLVSDAGNVTGTVGAYDSNNVLVTLSATTGAATYSERLTGLGGSAAGNYILAPNGNTFGTLTINPAVLTLTYSVANANGTYGTLATLGAVTLTGVAAPDIGQVGATIGVFDGNNNVVLLVATTAAGQYFERVTGLTGSAAGNYVLAANGNTNGILTINPKALTWSVANASGTYGTFASAGAVTLSGVLSGDAANVAGTLGLFDNGNNAVTLAATTNAGAYGERVTALTGSAAGNYVLASSGNTNGILTINPKAITWSVANASGTYGTLAAPGAVTFSGVLAGDAANLTGILALFDSASQAVTLALKTNAGIYAERITGLSGSAASNYVIAASGNTAGTLTILPKVLTVALQGAVSRVYDGTSTALLAASNYLLSGVLSGDTVALNNPTAGSFDNKNVGTGKTVSVIGLSISGTSASNYVLGATSISNAIGVVTPKTLTASLTGSVSRIYDGTTSGALASANYLLTGVVTDDVVILNNPATGSFDNKAVGTGKTVSITGLAISGADVANYVLGATSISGAIGTITPQVLTAALAGPVSRIYDGTTAAALVAANFLLFGIVSGDAVAINNPTTGSFDTKNAGTGKTVSVGGLSISGADSGNYMLASTAISGAVGTITTKTLTASLMGAVIRIYDGTTEVLLGVSNYVLAGVVSSDTVALNDPTTGNFDNKNVGTGKTVSVAGLSISGADASNYTLSATSISSAIGTITVKTLTASLTGTVGRIYDGTTAAALAASNYILAGIVSGDAVSLNNPAAGNFDSKNVGTSKVVSVAGLAISGGDAGNYALASTSVSGAIGTISPKTLNITAADETKTFGDVDPFLAYSFGGLIAGDTITGLLARALGEGPASYAIDLGTVSAGANYSIVFFGGTFLIIPASTTVGKQTVSNTTSFSADDNRSNASNDSQPGGSILCKVDNNVGDCRLGVN